MTSIIPFCECLREVRRAPATGANVACDDSDALGCPPPPGHRHLPNVQSPLGVPRGLECADNFPSSAPPPVAPPLIRLVSTMAKKKSTVSTPAMPASKTTGGAFPQFPPVSPKEYLECRVLLEDQILVIDVNSECEL